MAWYRVLVEGTGLDLPAADWEPLMEEHERIVGFFANRVVAASDEDAAKKKAVAEIAAEWPKHRYAHSAKDLRLVVSEIHRLSWLARFKHKYSGYVFFPEEQPGTQTDQ